MKVLKGFALGVLTLILLLSLIVFGFAMELRSTILNPRFVAAQLNRLDMSALFQEAAASPDMKGLPKELRYSIASSLKTLGPKIDARLRTATNSVFSYLMGKKASPGLAETLGSTFISSEFLDTVVDSFDIAALAGSALKTQIRPRLPPDAAWARTYIDTRLDKLLAKLAPQIKDQMKTAAGPIAEYLLGKRKKLNVVIATGPLVAAFRDDLREFVRDTPIPELEGLTQTSLDAAVDEVFNRFGSALPGSFTLNETVLGPAVQAQIAFAFRGAERGLAQLRYYVRFFQIGFWILATFIILLIAAIVLIQHRLAPATRFLGIVLLVFGAIEGTLFFAGKSLLSTQLDRIVVAIAPLKAWLPGLLDGFATPLLALGIGCVVAGSALVIVSIVAPHAPPSRASSP